MTSARPQFIHHSLHSGVDTGRLVGRRSSTLSTVVALALAAGLSGCADDSSPTAVEGAAIESPSARRVALRDVDIDQSDTYFAVQLTTIPDRRMSSVVGFAGSAYSPESYSAPWNNSYVEVGYDAAGQFRFNVYRGASSDPMIPSPPSLVRVAGGTVYTYDQQGTLTQQRPFYEYFDWAGLPGGATTHATPIYVWGCDYDAQGNCEGAASGAEPGALASVGQGTRARQLGDTLLEVRTPLMPASGVASQSGVNAGRRIVGAEVVRHFRRANIPVKDAGAGAARPARRWLLHTHSFRTIYDHNGANDTSVTAVSFRYVAMHLDEPRQRQRERGQPERPVRDGGSTESSPASVAPSVTAAAAGPCPEIQFGPRGTNYSGRLVWQHGWMSSSNTWCRMRDTVRKRFQVGFDQALSTAWNQGMATQANDLANRLMFYQTPSPNVVIAHSQGGLVARSLGQRFPHLVSGVITIGTPHLGARIATNARTHIQALLADAISDGCNGAPMCTLVNLFSSQLASGFLTYGLSESLPAANDLYERAPFIEALNSTHESFRRASVQVNVPPRWAIFRLIGDASSNPSTLDDLDGQNTVDLANSAYSVAQTMLMLSLSARWWTDDYGPGIRCSDLYYSHYWPPCTQPMSYQTTFWAREVWDLVIGYLELFARVMIAGMDRLDYTWTWLTTEYQDGARGDAFIQYSSQAYPNVPGTFVPRRVLGGTRHSHTGETSSTDVYFALGGLLPDMGVFQRR